MTTRDDPPTSGPTRSAEVTAVPQRPPPRFRDHFPVLVSYLLLTFALAYPLFANFSTSVPGGGDAWQNIWNLWWVKQALLVLHTNPYHTDLLFYPQGADLYFHTLVLTAGLAAVPMQLFGLGLIASYNLTLILTFVLGGFGMYLLCLHVTGHRFGAFTGGIVFAFAPYHFAHLFGHMNLSSLQWIPFFVLATLRAAEAPVRAGKWFRGRGSGLAWAAGAGALLALNAYTDWLYAIFPVVFTALLILWKLVTKAERHESQIRGITLHEATLRLLLGIAVFTVLTLPILVPTLREAARGYAQQPAVETLVYSSDVALAFTPSELHPLWGPAISRWLSTLGPYVPIKNPSERVVFLGYAVLLLSAFGLWRLRKDTVVRFWAFAAGTTWLLSLGPVLQLLGRTKFTAFDVNVPLPYLLLYRLPLVSIMRTPSRLTAITMLALAVLVSFAIRELSGWRLPSPAGELRAGARRRALLAVLPAVVLFEFFPVIPVVPPGWNVPIYGRIAADEDRFAVLELPLRPFSDYMAYQTIHGKALVGGYLSRQPPYLFAETEPVIKYFLDSTRLDDPVRDSVGAGAGVKRLDYARVKYCIVRWWAFTAEAKPVMAAKLQRVFGRPPDFNYPNDQVDAWQVYK